MFINCLRILKWRHAIIKVYIISKIADDCNKEIFMFLLVKLNGFALISNLSLPLSDIFSRTKRINRHFPKLIEVNASGYPSLLL